mgnify:CR=1 FL=1
MFLNNNPGYAPVDLDPAKLEYKEWVDECGNRLYSTVLKGTRTEQGITRRIDKEDWIVEYQTSNGKMHGYCRCI